MKVFQDIFLYTENELEKDFYERHRVFMKEHSRGFGAYLWKPQVVLQSLQRMPAGAVLVYADAGCQLNPEGVARLLEYAEMARGHPSGVLGFNIIFPIEEWTKREVIEYYRLTDDERRAPQHAGGIHVIHNTPVARAFVQHWRDDCENYSLVSDHRRLPPHRGFRDHRHDQSIFSILFLRYNCLSIPDETWWDPHWDSKKTYPIHARRMRG
jgi:hypothetical protein